MKKSFVLRAIGDAYTGKTYALRKIMVCLRKERYAVSTGEIGPNGRPLPHELIVEWNTDDV